MQPILTILSAAMLAVLNVSASPVAGGGGGGYTPPASTGCKAGQTANCCVAKNSGLELLSIGCLLPITILNPTCNAQTLCCTGESTCTQNGAAVTVPISGVKIL